MSLLHNQTINKLNAHSLRRVSHCPPHFQKIFFDLGTGEKNITDWIYENLDGRFYAQNMVMLANALSYMSFCVAFESHQEATYFSLFLIQINQV